MKTNTTNLLYRCAAPTGLFGLLLVIGAFLFFNTTYAQNEGQYTLGFPTSSTAFSSANSSTNGLTPFMASRRDSRNQYLYLASELTDQMAGSGDITRLAFFVSALPTGSNDKSMNNVNISIGTTTDSFIPSTTTIYPTTVFQTIASLTITATGWYTFDVTSNGAFPNGFPWDGSSNIVVEICMSGMKATYSPNYQVKTSGFAPVFMNNGFYGAITNAVPQGCNMVPGPGVTNATTTARRSRPDIQFTFKCVGTPANGTTVNTAAIDYCAGTSNLLDVTGSSKATDLYYRWQKSYNVAFIGPTDVAFTETYAAPKEDVDVWYRRLTKCGLIGFEADSGALLIRGGKTWDGTQWLLGATPTTEPDITETAIFDGNFDSNVNSPTTNFQFCSMTVKSGNVVIRSNDSVFLENAVTVTGGSLTFKNNASLNQNNDAAVNSGDVIFERNTTPVRRYDYTYWSTPVTPQSLFNLSPLTLFDKFYSYSGTAWVNENSANLMTVGKGYIVRAPQTFSTTVGTTFTGTFAGAPNNGDIAISVPAGATNMYFIGNPYPSGLNAKLFLEDANNSAILSGTIYFWTHNTAPNNNYTATDYASFNKTGAVGVGFASTSIVCACGNADNFTVPTLKIGLGQGFMAEPSALAPGGNIQFNNGMRYTAAADNTQFYKTATATTTLDAEDFNEGIVNNRLWLDLTSETGAFKEILVGYVNGATMDYDPGYDANNLSSMGVNLFSIIDNHQLVIQGRALPFENTDTVPLGFAATEAGNHKIALPHVDGLFETQDIYLEDTYLNTITNLKLSDYTFTATVGTFLDRFVLRYTDSALAVNANILNGNNVVAFNKKGNLVVNAGIKNIQSIKVFDLSGRLVLEKNNCVNTNVIFDKTNWNDQLMLVQITTEDNITVTRKVMF